MDWLWQNLFSNWVWVVGAGILSLLWQAFRKRYSTPISRIEAVERFAQTTATVPLLVAGFRFLYFSPEIVNEINVETKVKSWGDLLRLNQRVQDDQDTYFHRVLELESGNKLEVFRTKDRWASYLIVQVSMLPSESERRTMNRMPKDELEKLAYEWKIVSAEHALVSKILPGPSIALLKQIPISALTESSFIQAINEMDGIQTLLKIKGTNALKRFQDVEPAK